MTEQLVLDLLVSLGIVRIGRDEVAHKYLVHLVRDGTTVVYTVTDFKKEHQDAIAELEEEKHEVQQNRFTPPLSGEIGLGRGTVTTMRVQYWKKDEQLTPEEQAEKERLLGRINKEMLLHQRVIDAMNYVQVHYREIAHKLVPRTPASSGITGVKAVWNKGLKPAALHCLKQFPEALRQGKTELDVCREFLAQFAFSGETQYTAEQLLNAAVQIRLLDRAD
jgi:hypothetical protein